MHMECIRPIVKLNSMLKLSLCDYSDAYIITSGTITLKNTGTAAAPNNRKKYND